MKKIVLTGGPSGGKSSFLRYSSSINMNLEPVPEVATMLLSGGFPAPSEQHEWSYSWQKSLQTAIAITQIALEQVIDQRVTDTKRAIVYDRGLADGAAFLENGMEELCEIVNQTPDQIYNRYDKVIHLTTSAKQQRGYDKNSNIHRLEEADRAIELDDKTLEAWSGHHNRIIINENEKLIRNHVILEEIRNT